MTVLNKDGFPAFGKNAPNYTLDFFGNCLTLIGTVLQRNGGMTLNQLSRRSGIKQNRLRRILDGYSDFRVNELYDIGDALNVQFELKFVPRKDKNVSS